MNVAERSLGAISNVGFLLPALYLLNVGMFYESTCFFAITFFSTVYHACFDLQSCILLDHNWLQFLDFMWAFNAFTLIIVHFADIQPAKFRPPIHLVFLIIVMWVSWTDRFGKTIYYVFGISAGLALVYLLWHATLRIAHRATNLNVLRERRNNMLSVWDILSGIIGLVLFVAGFLFQVFANSNGAGYYWLLHSFWHVFLGIASTFMFKVRNPLFVLPFKGFREMLSFWSSHFLFLAIVLNGLSYLKNVLLHRKRGGVSGDAAGVEGVASENIPDLEKGVITTNQDVSQQQDEGQRLEQEQEVEQDQHNATV